MTETPPLDQIATENLIPPPERLRDEPVPESTPDPEDEPPTETTTQKTDTMRDEIRAGWGRALRRG